VALLAATPFATAVAAALPACPVKRLSGWPCPSCGAGRALLALAAGEWGAALAWNPLVAGGGLAFVLGGLLALVRSFRAAPLAEPRELPAPARWGIVAALAGNWLYLIAAGR
jgi:hypothetical protein